MWFVRTVFVPYLSKDSRKAAQGVQPLVRNEVTHPGSTFGCGNRGSSAGRTTWQQAMYRSAPLVPKGFSHFTPVLRCHSLLLIIFTPQAVFLCPFPGIAFSFITIRGRQTDADPFFCNIEPQPALLVILS